MGVEGRDRAAFAIKRQGKQLNKPNINRFITIPGKSCVMVDFLQMIISIDKAHGFYFKN